MHRVSRTRTRRARRVGDLGPKPPEDLTPVSAEELAVMREALARPTTDLAGTSAATRRFKDPCPPAGDPG